MFYWIHNHLALSWWLAASSVTIFFAFLIVAPLFAVRIPPDYFMRSRMKRPHLINRHPFIGLVLKIGMNLLGFVFIAIGILLLFLPGQGILTILAGLTMMNFPYKDRFVRWVVSRKPVLRSINWLRRRRGLNPLVLY
jgi:hypothetical protein